MAAVRAGLKLVVLVFVVGLVLAGAVLAVVGLLALGVAKAGGLDLRGPLAALDTAVAEGASRGPLAMAVAVGAGVGLAWSRAAARRSSGSERAR
jgi:hypothetical protein